MDIGINISENIALSIEDTTATVTPIEGGFPYTFPYNLTQ